MTEGPKILILSAHPALQKPRVNSVLIEHVRDLPGVIIHDLYEAYPDFNIDVEREQSLLEAHDVLLLQHPFFWYSSPALVKEWEDLVLGTHMMSAEEIERHAIDYRRIVEALRDGTFDLEETRYSGVDAESESSSSS